LIVVIALDGRVVGVQGLEIEELIEESLLDGGSCRVDTVYGGILGGRGDGKILGEILRGGVRIKEQRIRREEG